MRLRITIISVLFLCLCVASARAEETDVALQLADGLMQTQHVADAVTEYKRFLFFHADDPRASLTYYHLGVAYSLLGDTTQEDAAFSTAATVAENSTERDQRRIDAAVIQLSHAQYSSAEFNLLRVSSFSEDAAMRDHADFLLSVCYIYTARWSEAKQAMDRYAQHLDPAARQRFTAVFARTKSLHLRSPATAKWLSSVLPGAGQLYAGDARNALNAFALNCVTGFYVVQPLLQGDIVASFSNYMAFFYRYYQGNRYHAELCAKEKNDAINKRYAQQLLRQLPELVKDR